MEKRLIAFLSMMIIFFSPLWSEKKYSNTQKRLEEIKKQIEEKNKEYDEYMKRYNEGIKMMKQLKSTQKDYALKKKEYEKMIQSLNKKIEENREQYKALIKLQDDIMHEANLDFKKLYLSRFSSPLFYGRYQMIKDMIIRNMIIERKKIVDLIEGKKKVFMTSIVELTEKNKTIVKKKVETEVVINKSAEMIKSKEKELYMTDKKLKQIKEEIDRLNKTAKDLTQMIREIEKKSPYRKATISYTGIESKSLPWPAAGKVISKFGKEYIEDLKTWIVNDGIKIKTSPFSSVKAVMKGKVVYSGRFRGYGNLVVLEHENGIFTTYGFLSEVYVKNGDEVSQMSEIGKVGKDERVVGEENYESVLYFEIRRGDIPLDPLIYLKD